MIMMIKQRIFLLLLVAAAATACSKDDLNAAGQSGKMVLSFEAGAATAEADEADLMTRAGYDGAKSIWHAGDAVGVSLDANNNNLQFTQESGSLSSDGTRVRYSGTLNSPVSGNVTCVAYYPYSAGATVSSQTITTTFPATQTYQAVGGYKGLPVYSIYTGDYASITLPFKNLYSVIKLTLSKGSSLTNTVKLQRIVFQGNNNETISGGMQVNLSGATPVVTYTGTGKSITLDCGAGVTLTTTPQTFYIAVPAINYTNGYSFTLITDSGQVTKSAKNTGANYAVNKIYKAAPLTIDNLTIVTTIPDSNLRTALQNLGLISIIDALAGKVSITSAGLLATSIDISGKGIADLTGLDKFPALVTLKAGNNNLVSVDLSKLTLLTNLDLSRNSLSTLNLAANLALLTLDVSSNQLTSLNVSAQTLLTSLNVASNQLSTLNLAANVALLTLDVSSNLLTSLDLHNNILLTSVKCFGNVLTTLNISALKLLTGLYLDATSTATNCFSLLKFTLPVNAKVENLVADNMLVAALWTGFVCTGNTSIKTISLKNNVGILTAVVTNNTSLTSLNVTGSTLSSLAITKSGNAAGFTVTGAIL